MKITNEQRTIIFLLIGFFLFISGLLTIMFSIVDALDSDYHSAYTKVLIGILSIAAGFILWILIKPNSLKGDSKN